MFRRRLLIIFSFVFILIFSFGVYLNLNYQIPILMYHSVGKDCSICVSEERFSQQMEFLFKKKYKIISLDELVRFIKENKRPKKIVVITFDDGYENNYTNAYPILKKYNFKATVFMIINKIGERDYLTKEQLKELEKNKISIESHTLNHRYLPDSNREGKFLEIFKSKEVLENILGKRVNFISYPAGGFNSETQRLVKNAGYKAAFTTNRGIKRSKNNSDLYALKRIKITDKDSSFKFGIKISGFYHLFRRIKPPE